MPDKGGKPPKGSVPDINELTPQQLAKATGVSKRVADLVVRGRPYAVPEDLANVKGVVSGATPEQLGKLMDIVPPPGPDSPRALETIQARKGALRYGAARLSNGRTRAFIASDFGELLSAELSKGGSLNLYTLRLLSLLPHRLAALDDLAAADARDIIQGYAFREGRTLPGAPLDPRLSEEEQKGVKALGEVSDTIEQFLTNGCGPFDWRWYLIPNFNFKVCCDAHDICYSRGGTEEDRAKCDEDLRKCIEKMGHPWLAKIYSWAVSKGAKSSFTYRPPGKRHPTKDATPTPHGYSVPAGTHCAYRVKLTGLDYVGDDVGSETRFTITPDLEGQARDHPNAMSTIGILSKLRRGGSNHNLDVSICDGGTTCQKEVIVPIHIGEDKGGLGQDYEVKFTCDERTWNVTLFLDVKGASFGFYFQIMTTCTPPYF